MIEHDWFKAWKARLRADRVWIWLAWHVPRRLVYWCVIRVVSHEPSNMTLDEFVEWESVPARQCMDALKFWEKYPT